MGLGEVSDDRAVVRESSSGQGKGKGKMGKNGEERDDDSHYFESYSYNGTRVFISAWIERANTDHSSQKSTRL